jgi:branched-subunit amino acid aminotransferase/4-amino-4-deoxychorismate lyase
VEANTTNSFLEPPASTTTVQAPEARLSWCSGDSRLVGGHSPSGHPSVVDSWLIVDGRLRALELHEERFRRSCAQLLPSLSESTLSDFLLAVRSTLPYTGRWFPRVEAYADSDPELMLWLRPAPNQMSSIALWVPPHPDPRTSPYIKGPDLGVLAAFREQARAEGADDALLCTTDGRALETAHAALVWWREETLCLPALELPTLPSVTRTLLVELARRRGIEVIHEHCDVAELYTLETWTVNALHGIRRVSRWLGTDGPRTAPVVASRAQSWAMALDELMLQELATVG